MKEIFLIKHGEIALKGLNRYVFEDILVKNLKRKLSPLGKFSYQTAQSTMVITPLDDGVDYDEAADRISKVFGIAAFSRACAVGKDFDEIAKAAVEYTKDALANVKTFKVEAKRSDKKYPMTSPEIGRELGAVLLKANPHLKVDVLHPEQIVLCEIRDFGAYIHCGSISGAGGIPVGSSGKAALLISGGIDSPVAGYMMAKRGVELLAVHFVSPPYTSERAKLKVVDLTRKICDYCGRITLHVVSFTHFQEEIRDKCPDELFTIIMRRYMMKIAQEIGRQNYCDALITGESVGQVASQTMKAIACTDIVCEMPVFRPLAGMDKEEIIKSSRRIGTFETSILPYEDCCTVFTPKHPKTKPKLEDVLEAEKHLDEESLMKEALEGVEVIVCNSGDVTEY